MDELDDVDQQWHEVGNGNFINAAMGVYKGSGAFNGTLDNSGIVAPGN